MMMTTRKPMHNNPGFSEQDGSAEGTPDAPAPAPDAQSDRLAPTRPGKPVRSPLPISEIEKEEDDAKGG
jgi:hypothetical protein